MKICMIIEAWSPFYAGGQVHCRELCKKLIEKYNCKIELYTRKLKVDGVVYKENESYFDGNLKIIRAGFVSEYVSFLGRLSWVFSVFFNNIFSKYDIIHGQANLGGLPTWMLGLFKRSSTVFTVHGSGLDVWDELKGRISAKINRFIEKTLQTGIHYDREISVDKRFLKFKNKNKPIVIPNGVDIGKYDKVKVKKNKVFKIIFVGRLHPQKGLRFLIDAVDMIKKKKRFEVHLIGSGKLGGQLKKKVNKLKLNRIIKFRGKVFGDELIKEYKSSHLFVLPSVFEGQPLTLLEAWAAKLPVLVTDVGGNRDFVENDKNGWIIPSKDSKILAETLLKAIQFNMLKLDKMGRNGYRLVKNKYNWDIMTKKTYKVYKELMKK